MTITYIHILSKCKIKYLPRKITIFLILQKDTLRSKRKTWTTALVRILMQNEMTGFSKYERLECVYTAKCSRSKIFRNVLLDEKVPIVNINTF